MLGQLYLILALSSTPAYGRLIHEVYKKITIGSEGIQPNSTIREVHLSTNFSCTLECLIDDNCLAVVNTQDGPNDWKCALLDEVASCAAESPDFTLSYYQSDVLSSLKTVTKYAGAAEEPEPLPNTTWLADCGSQYCRHHALIGLEEDEDEWDNLNEDIDYLICGTFGGDLEFDLDKSESIHIRTPDVVARCPDNMVVTAMWDDNLGDGENYFDSPDLMKCSPVMNGWKVDQENCTTFVTKEKGIKIECPQLDDQPTLVVGVNSIGGTDPGVSDVKCCALYKLTLDKNSL